MISVAVYGNPHRYFYISFIEVAIVFHLRLTENQQQTYCLFHSEMRIVFKIFHKIKDKSTLYSIDDFKPISEMIYIYIIDLQYISPKTVIIKMYYYIPSCNFILFFNNFL